MYTWCPGEFWTYNFGVFGHVNNKSSIAEELITGCFNDFFLYPGHPVYMTENGVFFVPLGWTFYGVSIYMQVIVMATLWLVLFNG